MTNKKALFFCIIFSFAVHLAALFFLDCHLLRSEFFAFSEVKPAPSFAVEEKRENVPYLEISFFKQEAKNVQYREESTKVYVKENPSHLPQTDYARVLARDLIHESRVPFDISTQQRYQLKNIKLKHFSELASLSLPRAITFAKKIHPTSVKPPGLTSSQKGKSPFLPRHELAMPKVKQRNIPFPLEIMHQHLIAFKTPHMKEIESTRTHLHVPPASYKKQFGHLARLPSSYDLQTSSCGHDFDVDVVYNRREDDKGYIFALTLIPKPDCSFKKMKQNVFFVIDRSSSIGQERLHTVRHAILASLPLLESEDRFNIITFDSGMEELFTNEVSVNPFTIRDARRFLLSQKVGSFFSSPKISYPLSRVLSKALREDECYSIIYLSNGATLEKGSNRRFFDEWMRKNRGRVAFYSVSLTSDKNNAILDYFSSSNKGRLFSSRTPRGIKRQLQKAVHSIHRPVANHMTAHIFLSSKDAQMKLFPSSRQMPNLYLDQPYVFIGTTKTADPFVLFLQGRNAERWFNIKKSVSFDRAEKGGFPLYQQWAIQRSYLLYDSFLLDGNPKHLKEAERVLLPFELTPAFR